MNKRYIHAVVLLLLLFISTLAVGVMFKNFLMVIFLSALTAAMATPIYRKYLKMTKGREGLSSAMTLMALFLVVLLPLTGVLVMFVGQAAQLSKKIQPRIEVLMNSETSFSELFQKVPRADILLKHKDTIIAKGGEIVSKLTLFFANRLQSGAISSLNFIFLLFLYIYSLFFFIKDGRKLLDLVLYYLPLPSNEEELLLERFTSVTKATLKGTLLIGGIQGILAGVAMGIAQIESAFFWSIIMMVLSVIPVVGTVLVWLPAGIILIASGSVVPGILLLLWCGIVVGNIDNLLRPKLVGQDSGLHELLILFSTLGGLKLFGMAGFILGPILVAIWVTLWEIYGEMFKAYLPDVDRADKIKKSMSIENKEEKNSEDNDTTTAEIIPSEA